MTVQTVASDAVDEHDSSAVSLANVDTMGVDGPSLYSSTRLLELTGISYRQLDHWVSTGKLHCSQPNPGSGRHRSFTHEQVETVYYAARLILHGFTPEAALDIACHLAADGNYTLRIATIFELSIVPVVQP